jgi:hypothetical protein
MFKYLCIIQFIFHSLGGELESIRSLFTEKEKELSLAVQRVDELSRQLDALRRGRNQDNNANTALTELARLRKELAVSTISILYINYLRIIQQYIYSKTCIKRSVRGK